MSKQKQIQIDLEMLDSEDCHYCEPMYEILLEIIEEDNEINEVQKVSIHDRLELLVDKLKNRHFPIDAVDASEDVKNIFFPTPIVLVKIENELFFVCAGVLPLPDNPFAVDLDETKSAIHNAINKYKIHNPEIVEKCIAEYELYRLDDKNPSVLLPKKEEEK